MLHPQNIVGSPELVSSILSNGSDLVLNLNQKENKEKVRVPRPQPIHTYICNNRNAFSSYTRKLFFCYKYKEVSCLASSQPAVFPSMKSKNWFGNIRQVSPVSNGHIYH